MDLRKALGCKTPDAKRLPSRGQRASWWRSTVYESSRPARFSRSQHLISLTLHKHYVCSPGRGTRCDFLDAQNTTMTREVLGGWVARSDGCSFSSKSALKPRLRNSSPATTHLWVESIYLTYLTQTIHSCEPKEAIYVKENEAHLPRTSDCGHS